MATRIHIFGASGSGTTTLGRHLAERLRIPHFDTDDYFWIKTEIPYTKKRELSERLELLRTDLLKHPSWVLSGSFCDWGDLIIPLFTLVVFLWIPRDVRMARLKQREIERYGLESVSPGGWFYKNHEDFMAYASAYDSAGLDVDIRSLKLHEQWMSKLPCKIIRFEQPLSVQELAKRVEEAIDSPWL